MRSFTIATMLPYLAMLAWLEWSVGRFGVMRISEHLTLALMLVILPLTMIWLARGLAERRLPRRFLSSAGRHTQTATALGLVNAVLSSAIILMAAYFLPKVYESALIAATLFATTYLIIHLTPTRHPGRCESCNYDLRASLDSPRCPECGIPFRPSLHCSKNLP